MHVVPRRADEAVVALARRQHGVVTARQLLQAGVGPNAITSKVARGWLRRIHKGVYVVGALESELTAPTAALAAYGRNAILSHRTAATIWRLLPPRPTDPIHVTLLNANRRPRPGITIHRARTAETRRRYGLRITSPAQTLADLEDDVERAYNEALVLGLTTHQEVRRHATRSPSLQAVVEEVPGMTRSKMERKLRALIKQAGLPAPQSNVKVAGHEVDLYWPAHRLVVEFDGWSTHSSRTRFESDRLKDATLQLAGERVLRVTGRQLERRSEALVARLATAISTGRSPGGPLVN